MICAAYIFAAMLMTYPTSIAIFSFSKKEILDIQKEINYTVRGREDDLLFTKI
jgi:hypothetical protein